MIQKIKVISDTHGKHGFVDIEKVDLIICAGDMGTTRDPFESTKVITDFIEWLQVYPATFKIVIAGNHDLAIEKKYVVKENFAKAGIIYLEHESVEIENIKIFGSPYTPTFGNGWAFNKDRAKLYNYWQAIPEDTDIVITHGPPKGILDSTRHRISEYDNTNYGNTLVYQCGCKSLLKRMMSIQPKYHIFGHIHPEEDCPNGGIMQINGCKTQFVNASVCNLHYNPVSNGIILNYDNKTNI